MKTYIVLLRGINVGGHKKILMADLRQLLADSGFENVQTYIQSGNIILNSDHAAKQVEEVIADAIKEHYGFEVPVLVIQPNNIKTILDDYPFRDEKITKSYFSLLFDEPDDRLINELNQLIYPDEEFFITKTC
ncbi:MAG: DUF1697 domain-containing protein, partial [Bacteroidota bacterium]